MANKAVEAMEDRQDDRLDAVEAGVEVKQDPAAIVDWSVEEEARAKRKLDLIMITLLGVLYMLSYVDRGNIGNAKTAGMGKKWHMTSNQYSWLVTIYYFGYIFFQWLVLAWRVVRLPIWVACMAAGWGAMSMIQGGADNFAGLMVLRFFIGVFEAGFGPGVALYLTFFYHRREMALRYGLWISFSALASAYASALAYAIVHAHVSIADWKLLFIIEGIPTLFVAIIAWLYLPNGPGECKFLTERENHIMATRAYRYRGGDTEKKINYRHIWSAFLDYKNYFTASIIFCLNTAFGSLPVYLPTILEGMGYSSIRAQGLSAPPYLLAYFLCIGASFLSDWTSNRSFWITAFTIVGGVGYIILGTVHTVGVRYFSTYLVCGGVFPAVALTFTWVTDNQGSASKRGAGLTIFGMIGQVGPILGARIFPTYEAPMYKRGMYICAGLLFFAAVLSQVLSFSLRWQNRKRNRADGLVDAKSMPLEVAEYGDDHPNYRYIL